MNAIMRIIAVPAISFKRLFGFSLKKILASASDYRKVDQAIRFQEQAKEERLNNSRYL